MRKAEGTRAMHTPERGTDRRMEAKDKRQKSGEETVGDSETGRTVVVLARAIVQKNGAAHSSFWFVAACSESAVARSVHIMTDVP